MPSIAFQQAVINSASDMIMDILTCQLLQTLPSNITLLELWDTAVNDIRDQWVCILRSSS